MRKIGISICIFTFLVVFTSLSSQKEAEDIKEVLNATPKLDSIPEKRFLRGVNEFRFNKAKKNFDNISGISLNHEEAFYLALYYYPELKNTKIIIEEKSIGTTLQTQPMFGSIFKNSAKRSYKISLNNNKDFEGVFFDDIPFNAQIGLVAHELAHILDYKHKSTFELIGTGMKFLSKKGRAKYERSIDRLTVFKGFGWQLRDWADYSFNNSISDEAYKNFKKETYLSVQKIDSLITNTKIYENQKDNLDNNLHN